MSTASITTDFDVPATMRDGVVLRANIFRPSDDGPYPVALARTPYGKDFFSVSSFLDAVRMARSGYIVVVQDVRGRFTSGGDWIPFQHEGLDGYDTVEWAAALPGSNGNVGMWGPSYLGFTQWSAAIQAPPHLKAIMPTVTWADPQADLMWRGGALELGKVADWHIGVLGFDELLRRYADASPVDKMQALGALVHEIDSLHTEGYLSLPLKDFAPLKRLGLAPDFFDGVAHPNSREHNLSSAVSSFYDRITVPAYSIGGWYDIFCRGTLQNFSALRMGGSTAEAREAKVLIGPWTHGNTANVIGDLDFGFAASMAFINLQTDLTRLTQRWFDFWLKGIDNGITQEPAVKIFVMGTNCWRDENEWPLARTQYTPYYLHRDGKLSTQQPGDEGADQFTYDPASPTPTDGGAVLMHPLFHAGVKDQRSLEQRSDVLVYTSEALERDIEVTGNITVKLWAASDAPDTDFVAALIDVYPNGLAQNLADGIIRARYRNGESPELLIPGQSYEFTIDLWATANVFKAGHAIRLHIASANFPRWDRNPNTGEPFGVSTTLRPAQQTVLHDADHPSHVILSIIPV